MQNQKQNLWLGLESNWDHFFWMTGEIPPTLDQLCNELVQFFGRRITKGKCVLSFRNQVSTTWCR